MIDDRTSKMRYFIANGCEAIGRSSIGGTLSEVFQSVIGSCVKIPARSLLRIGPGS
jgi:hypothetical protein